MNIIVASNNVFRRELSSYLLSEAGYTIHEVSDSAMLLHYLVDIRPHLVLLDTQLIRPDSLARAQHIMEDQSVQIIFLTDKTTSPDYRRIMCLNGDNWLDWPYQAKDLLDHVQALLVDMHDTSIIS